MAKLVITMLVLAMATGCASVQTGVGQPADYELNQRQADGGRHEQILRKPRKGESASEGTPVLMIPSYQRALRLAQEAVSDAWPDAQVRVTPDATLRVSNREFWRGDVVATIIPELLNDKNTESVGYRYRVEAQGRGSNASLAPGYIAQGFFESLAKLREQRSLEIRHFSEYEVSSEKGIREYAPASIPISYSGFQDYVDEANDRFVGIWADPNGQYTLGLVKSSDDPRYTYLAMVLESERAGWEPGEIKAKFSSLNVGQVSVGRWKMRNHLEEGVTWRAQPDALVALNSPGQEQLALIKVYRVTAATARGSLPGPLGRSAVTGCLLRIITSWRAPRRSELASSKGRATPRTSCCRTRVRLGTLEGARLYT